MTDKEQIIVDDCKVEECINFRDEVSIDSTVLKNACSIGLWQRHYKNLEESCKMSCKCDENPNCYFKQQARKTQECEIIQKSAEEIASECRRVIGNYKEDNIRYRKALDEIEEYIYTDCEYNDGCDRNICIRCKYSNVHDKRILDIISKAKGHKCPSQKGR